jgi:hypothetical protein
MNVHHAEQFRTNRAKLAALTALGPWEWAKRDTEIEALPIVEWKGRRLRTIRCHGTSGKGPHNLNVDEALPWALMDINRFLCPFHANDCWDAARDMR